MLEGYKIMFDNSIVTVWSAPNYCYRWVCSNRHDLTQRCRRCGNVASVLNLEENGEQVYKTFEAAPQVSVVGKRLYFI